jgi:cephalosporin-C deacetylase-like acetyl esterase
MRLLAPCVLLTAAVAARAADDLTVLTPRDAPEPRAMLHAHLLAEAKTHFDARRAAVERLKTPADVERRQTELRARFIDALGGFPDKTPLNPRVVGTIPRDGFRIERVIYESRPGHHVTANFYRPAGDGPFPGVLMPIGHSGTSKAADYIQHGATLLARNGFAVLTYDPIGQGEWRQLLDKSGKPAIPSSTNEHTLIGVGALLVGWNTAAYRVWDGIRSLDYLAGRPEVDPKRIGCTGCSGGGTMTSYLMALDDRIAVAAPSCYVTSLERLFATIGPQDAEQNIPGQVAFGLEHADYLTLRAPRPTLILAATRDFFDIQGTWTSFREAKRVYGLLGHAERVDLYEGDTTHGFPKGQREAMLRWMRRWLQGKDDAPTETDFPLVPERDLWCTRTGQVLEDLKGKSVFDLTAERARQLAAERGKVKRTPDELRKEVARLIGVSLPVPAATVTDAGVLRRDGYEVRKKVFTTEPGVLVPALLFTRGDDDRGPLVIYLHGRGMAADAGTGGRIEKLVKDGKQVLAIDVRGTGETAPSAAPAGKPGYFGVDFKEAFLAMHLNRPLLGQKVSDVLAVLATLRDDKVRLIGVGNAGPVAVHAAALDSRITDVTVEDSIASWTDVARTPLAQDQLTNVVPGALRVYDLPHLARLAGRAK